MPLRCHARRRTSADLVRSVDQSPQTDTSAVRAPWVAIQSCDNRDGALSIILVVCSRRSHVVLRILDLTQSTTHVYVASAPVTLLN